MRALPLLLLAACGGAPTVGELYGQWANFDADTVRVFWFEELGSGGSIATLPQAFRLFNYPSGTEPVEVQGGEYDVVEPTSEDRAAGILAYLYQHVRTDHGVATDQEFANDILGFGAGVLVLESASAPDGRRTFERVDELP
jgi:hypothetical protein